VKGPPLPPFRQNAVGFRGKGARYAVDGRRGIEEVLQADAVLGDLDAHPVDVVGEGDKGNAVAERFRPLREVASLELIQDSLDVLPVVDPMLSKIRHVLHPSKDSLSHQLSDYSGRRGRARTASAAASQSPDTASPLLPCLV